VITGEEIEWPAIVRKLLLAVCPSHNLEGSRVQPRWEYEILGVEDRPVLHASTGAGAGSVGIVVSGPVVECHSGAIDKKEPHSAFVRDADGKGTGGTIRNSHRIRDGCGKGGRGGA